MTANIKNNCISDEMFKLKQESSQTGYLSFELASTYYAINIQNVVNILDKTQMVYLSHLNPPVIGMQFYNKVFIPVVDFAGYRPYSKKVKLLILSSNMFRKDQPFGLIIDEVNSLHYIKQKDLINNPHPFNNLLPSYFYIKTRSNKLFFLDIKDLENQID